MSIRYMILPLLLALLTAGLSLGQTADNASIVDDNSSIEAAMDMNATLPANESTPVNGTENATAVAVNLTPAVSGPNLNYIWQFSGIEAGPITMVLEQNGSDLFGRAKYEPEGGKAWNADVIGSVAGEKVDLTMSALKDNVPIITRLSGILANEDINGNFTQASEGKVINNGTFNAMWINPDTSSYTPATVEAPAVATPAPAEVTSAAQPAAAAVNTTAVNKTEKRFVDVHEYKDKIGPGGDLSGIPPGMG
ncbi:MAG: hypothetical protein QG605_484 [Euryarchaeota archaeon]|nr:hypothetical protein [Euryarchaeota archaeon]